MSKSLQPTNKRQVRVMISQKAFAQGRNWQNIGVPIRGYSVDHADVWFAPHGHEGAPAPHYDIILFFVPHAVHMKLCNPSGKLPDFVLQPNQRH